MWSAVYNYDVQFRLSLTLNTSARFDTVDMTLYTTISHVLNEQGTGYEHIFSLVQTFNIDGIEKWGTSSERASKN